MTSARLINMKRQKSLNRAPEKKRQKISKEELISRRTQEKKVQTMKAIKNLLSIFSSIALYRRQRFCALHTIVSEAEIERNTNWLKIEDRWMQTCYCCACAPIAF